jgi:hypothetical protein
MKYQMPFGKYKGSSLGAILSLQPTYVTEFLAGIKTLRDPLKTHVSVAIKHWNKTNAEEPAESEHDAGGTLLDR